MAACQAVIYVKKDATGLNDGSSWANAYTDLQDGIQAATDNSDNKDVWVARVDSEGYYPGNEASDSFVLTSGVNIYGGFSGDETSIESRYCHSLTADDLFADTVDSTSLTVLNGQIDKSLKSYHVVKINEHVESAISCFFITNGYADGSDIEDMNGGGMLISNNDDTKGSKPLITQCVFKDNAAIGDGGAIYGWHYAKP